MKTRSLARCPTALLFLVGCLPYITGISPSLWDPVMIISTCFLARWAYVVARELTRRTTSIARLDLPKFARGLIYVCAGLAFLMMAGRLMEADDVALGWLNYCAIPVLIALVYWSFYCLNFLSKSIAQSETQKPAKFDQYAGYFFCLIFFPFGIWWVNRKITNLL